MLLLGDHGCVLLLKLRHFLLAAAGGCHVRSRSSHLRLVAAQRRVLALLMLSASHVHGLLLAHHGLCAGGTFRRWTSRQLLSCNSRDRLVPIPRALRRLRLSTIIVRRLLLIPTRRRVRCHNASGPIIGNLVLWHTLWLHLRDASADHLLRASVGSTMARLQIVASALLRSCNHNWLVCHLLLIVLGALLCQVVELLVLLIGRRRLVVHLMTAANLGDSLCTVLAALRVR